MRNRMHIARKIKVLIVDDSAVMRQLLTAILDEDPAIEVVGTAADPYIARKKIKSLRPDVLTLDVEMPGMDGITFLEKLMRLHPLPVVMVSSLTERGAESTLRALELGAVDFVTKPQMDLHERIAEIGEELRAKVHAASQAHLRTPPVSKPGDLRAQAVPFPGLQAYSDIVIVMGASAGGTQAIKEILEKLPAGTPGIVIVQHMPQRFTRHFANRLNDQCEIEVREAENGDRVTPGLALIAPGGHHIAVTRDSPGFAVKVYVDEPVNLHRPSVDVLFKSAAEKAGGNALGIILTGMGSDGAHGLLAMRRAGAHTIAQDEHSCVVFGMPDQAIRKGGVCAVHALENISGQMMRWAQRNGADEGVFG